MFSSANTWLALWGHCGWLHHGALCFCRVGWILISPFGCLLFWQTLLLLILAETSFYSALSEFLNVVQWKVNICSININWPGWVPHICHFLSLQLLRGALKTSSQAPRCASCKADKLKSWKADKWWQKRCTLNQLWLHTFWNKYIKLLAFEK